MDGNGDRETVSQDHGAAGTTDTGDTTVPAGEQGQVSEERGDRRDSVRITKGTHEGEVREVDQDSTLGGRDTDVSSNEPDSGRPGRTDTDGLPVRSGLTVERPTAIKAGGEKRK